MTRRGARRRAAAAAIRNALQDERTHSISTNVNDSRYVIGIDLGTTNSAVAYAERRSGGDPLAPALRVFEVPQVVAPGDVQPRPVLPSFLYLADAHERASGTLAPGVGHRGRSRGGLCPRSTARSFLPAR